jgi:hypothetical protein
MAMEVERLGDGRSAACAVEISKANAISELRRTWSAVAFSQRALFAAAVLLLASASALRVQAQETGTTSVGATSSNAARQEALRAIPWNQIPAAERRQLQTVVKEASYFRRLPTRVIDCDPDLFTFLLQHPEVVVDVWQMMGVSKVTLQQTAAQAYRADDGAGTSGDVRFLYSNWGPDARNLAVVYADGGYDGQPFINPLRAESVLVLQSGAVRETNGRNYVSVRVDSFVRIHQVGIDLIARTVQPWINKTADRNFIDTLGFVSTFSQTAEKNPQGMQRLASRLRTVDEPTRGQLVNLCFRAAQRYAKDDGGPGSKPYVLAQQVELPVEVKK